MWDDRHWLRSAAATGIVFVVLSVVSAFLAGAPPVPDDPLPDIRAYYADHRNALLIGAYLTGLATALGLWFIVGLSAVLRRAEGGDGVLSMTVLVAGAVTSAIALVPALILAALAFNTDRDDAVFRALFDLGNLSIPMILFPWALFIGAASWVMQRTGVFPRWLGWAGLVEVVILLISAAGLGTTSGALAAGGPISFLAFLLGMAWTLVTAVYMFMMHPAEQPVASMATA